MLMVVCLYFAVTFKFMILKGVLCDDAQSRFYDSRTGNRSSSADELYAK